MNEDEFRKQSIRKLDELGKKIDALIQVVAITSRKESVLKGKSKTDQIKLLSDLDLPRTIIAWIAGTTPDAVSARLSEMKAEKRKTGKPEEVEKSNE